MACLTLQLKNKKKQFLGPGQIQLVTTITT